MYDIITIGSATRDVFLVSRAMHPHRAKDALTHIEACFPFGAKINIDEIHFDTGGGGTNNAATFARLGKLKTAALARVGKDSAGHDIVQALKNDRVDTAFIQTTAHAHTAYSTILSPGGEVGERTILVYRGASAHFEHEKIPWKKLRANWFYVSSLGGDIALLQKILAHAKKISAKVAWNPGGQELSHPSVIASPDASVGVDSAKQSQRSPRSLHSLAMTSFLSQITFLLLNREEASRLTGVKFNDTRALLRALARITPSAIMTDGPKGAYAVHQGIAYYVPSVGHHPKNLTGAGDAFGSGFLTGWIKTRGDIKYALRLGSFNADSVVQHIGAKVGILHTYPSTRELNKLTVKFLKI